MTWFIISGESASIATQFGGEELNKINNMFNAVDISDIVTIHPDVLWTYTGQIALREIEEDTQATTPAANASHIFVDDDTKQITVKKTNEARGGTFSLEGSGYGLNVIFKRTSEINIAANNERNSNPIILARWTLTNTAAIYQDIRTNSTIFSSGIRDSGGSTVNIGLYSSDDNGTTWDSITGANTSFTGAAFGKKDTDQHRINIGFEPTDLAVIAFNGDGATTGRIRETVIYVDVLLPIGLTAERTV